MVQLSDPLPTFGDGTTSFSSGLPFRSTSHATAEASPLSDGGYSHHKRDKTPISTYKEYLAKEPTINGDCRYGECPAWLQRGSVSRS